MDRRVARSGGSPAARRNRHRSAGRTAYAGCPRGPVHDWIGATFIPNASIEALQAVVHDYDRYRQTYNPAVADSKALARDMATQEFSMIWKRRVLFVDAAMQGHYEAHDFLSGRTAGIPSSTQRAFSRLKTTDTDHNIFSLRIPAAVSFGASIASPGMKSATAAYISRFERSP